MSESSNSGGESSTYHESSSASNQSTKNKTLEEQKINFTEIKNKLKLIEIAVTKTFTSEEKSAFIQLFRQVIVDNEKEVVSFPTATFFISKFEHLDSPLLTTDFKTKIMTNLYTKQNEDKQNNSKLKYW